MIFATNFITFLLKQFCFLIICIQIYNINLFNKVVSRKSQGKSPHADFSVFCHCLFQLSHNKHKNKCRVILFYYCRYLFKQRLSIFDTIIMDKMNKRCFEIFLKYRTSVDLQNTYNICILPNYSPILIFYCVWVWGGSCEKWRKYYVFDAQIR